MTRTQTNRMRMNRLALKEITRNSIKNIKYSLTKVSFSLGSVFRYFVSLAVILLSTGQAGTRAHKTAGNQSPAQPRPQSLLRVLGVQNGGAKKTLAWRTAGHVSPKILEIVIVSKWRRARDWLILWSRDLLFARVFFAPTRHLES